MKQPSSGSNKAIKREKHGVWGEGVVVVIVRIRREERSLTQQETMKPECEVLDCEGKERMTPMCGGVL